MNVAHRHVDHRRAEAPFSAAGSTEVAPVPWRWEVEGLPGQGADALRRLTAASRGPGEPLPAASSRPPHGEPGPPTAAGTPEPLSLRCLGAHPLLCSLADSGCPCFSFLLLFTHRNDFPAPFLCLARYFVSGSLPCLQTRLDSPFFSEPFVVS